MISKPDDICSFSHIGLRDEKTHHQLCIGLSPKKSQQVFFSKNVPDSVSYFHILGLPTPHCLQGIDGLFHFQQSPQLADFVAK